MNHHHQQKTRSIFNVLTANGNLTHILLRGIFQSVKTLEQDLLLQRKRNRLYMNVTGLQLGLQLNGRAIIRIIKILLTFY